MISILLGILSSVVWAVLSTFWVLVFHGGHLAWRRERVLHPERDEPDLGLLDEDGWRHN